MGGSNQPSSTTTTQNTAPWEAQQPYYRDVFSQAQNLYNSNKLAPTAYPGQQVANQSPDTLAAMNSVRNTANNATLAPSANQLATDTINGKYLDVTQNPGWQQGLADIKRAYSTGTAAQTDAAAARSGAYGGSAYKELVGQNNRSYADALNKFAGDIYNDERARQTQTLALSPSINAGNYADAAQLGNVGAMNEGYNQDLINSAIQNYNINQSAPYTALSNYQGLIGGNLGGTGYSTSSTPFYKNQLSSALGGSLAGAGLGLSLAPLTGGISIPAAALLGGGLGGGLGYFGG